jgi:hypothetical protein
MIFRNFDYLIRDHDFHIIRKEFAPQAMGNAVVVFESARYVIEIAVDRNQALIRIRNRSGSGGEWFEFTDVLKYFAPHIEGPYLFPEKTPGSTWDELLEAQLARLSAILRQYCGPLLNGVAWDEEEIRKNQEDRRDDLMRKLSRGPDQ